MNKQDFSKRIVILVLVLNIIFTVAVLWIFAKVGSEPISLIAAWFGFTTGELWMLSSIKKAKVNRKEGESFESQLEAKIDQ